MTADSTCADDAFCDEAPKVGRPRHGRAYGPGPTVRRAGNGTRHLHGDLSLRQAERNEFFVFEKSVHFAAVAALDDEER
jgi:hypothetical protein